jgi:Toprim-like/DNA primase catalytic core, N-terminal domain
MTEVLALPAEDKRQLAMALLEEFGARHIRPANTQGEIIHTCVLPFGLHSHQDAHPSASLNYLKLVYNCLGCGCSGGLMWLVSSCRGTTSTETKAWLLEKATVPIDDIPAFIAYLDSIYNPERPEAEPIPRYSPRVLDPWRFIHPYMTEVRHIPIENLRRFDIGYGDIEITPTFHSERIIIPHYWKGELVGWLSRRIANDGSAKYLNTEGFPKSQTIYNYDPKVPAMVAEGPLSVLAHPDEPHMESTFSAEVTKQQVRLLAEHPRVTLFFDNDTAGWKATQKVGEALLAYTEVDVVQNPYDADPADIGDDYRDLPRAPFSVWAPPSTLLPYARPRTRLAEL